MGRIRRGRFVALTAAGLLVAGAGAVATAQSGMNLSAGSSVATAHIEGLTAQEASIAAGHGALGSEGDPVSVISLKSVGIRKACLKLKSVDVPVVGTVTIVASLPEDAKITAEGISIDAKELDGPLTLDDVAVGTGAVPPSERTGQSGTGITAGALTSDGIDVDVTGVHAAGLTTSAFSLHAERGEGTC